MEQRELYSITESRKLPGGISPNSIYALLNAGEIPRVIVGRRRFIAAAAIAGFIEAATTTKSPTDNPLRT
jgi:helix-turn-helix protein